MSPYEDQTIKLTRAAACEAVGRIIRDMGWANKSCADITYAILTALGFKGLP